MNTEIMEKPIPCVTLEKMLKRIEGEVDGSMAYIKSSVINEDKMLLEHDIRQYLNARKNQRLIEKVIKLADGYGY